MLGSVTIVGNKSCVSPHLIYPTWDPESHPDEEADPPKGAISSTITYRFSNHEAIKPAPELRSTVSTLWNESCKQVSLQWLGTLYAINYKWNCEFQTWISCSFSMWVDENPYLSVVIKMDTVLFGFWVLLFSGPSSFLLCVQSYSTEA